MSDLDPAPSLCEAFAAAQTFPSLFFSFFLLLLRLFTCLLVRSHPPRYCLQLTADLPSIFSQLPVLAGLLPHVHVWMLRDEG